MPESVTGANTKSLKLLTKKSKQLPAAKSEAQLVRVQTPPGVNLSSWQLTTRCMYVAALVSANKQLTAAD